jgi:hypothetical protein
MTRRGIAGRKNLMKLDLVVIALTPDYMLYCPPLYELGTAK